MTVLFDGVVDVHYGQFYIESNARFDGDMRACFEGQRNGLAGAAMVGVVFLVTGLHTGPVGVSVHLHASAPEAGAMWEDVVEVSVSLPEGGASMVEWAAETGHPLALPAGDYRLRYSAHAMQAGNELDTNVDAEPVDTYRIDFWPAETAPDQIVRQTSEIAAYWHDWARTLK